MSYRIFFGGGGDTAAGLGGGTEGYMRYQPVRCCFFIIRNTLIKSVYVATSMPQYVCVVYM